MTTVIKFQREGDMLSFDLVEGRKVKERKIPFVFSSKRECFFSPLSQVISQVEILLRSCKILQESCKILIKIKILIRSCLTFKILKNLSKNLVRS